MVFQNIYYLLSYLILDQEYNFFRSFLKSFLSKLFCVLRLVLLSIVDA